MKKTHLKYMPGLDGLRAVAVLAIIIFHLNPYWLPGGFLGVDTFFIISGYLITTLLLIEYQETGTINFIEFWKKRIKRLVPAVFFMIFIVFNYCVFFRPDLIEQLKKDIIAAVFYVSNWWYIFDNVDYFHSFDPRPFQHLWSLAIEEQFYLFFPIVLYIMFSLRSKKIVFSFFALVALCSGALMATMYHPGVEIARLYFGTDTRLQTIILGVLLAFIWPPYKLKQKPHFIIQSAVSVIGIVSFALLIIAFFILGEESAELYRGGFFILGIITLCIIATSVHPSSILKHILSLPILTWIGRYSYSLYLWHYPVIVLTNNALKKQSFWIYLFEIILTVLLAVISYHLVETPIRKEGIKFFFNIRSAKRMLTSLLLISLLGLTGYQWFNAKAVEKEVFKTTTTASTIPKPKALPNVQIDDTYVVTTNPTMAPLFIGDSVLVDIYPQLQAQFPNATIDGEVGRSIYKAIPLGAKYSMFNQPGRTVVLFLGTNGDFEEVQLNQMLSEFDKAEVYLVTSKVPLPYEGHVNQLMKEAAAKYKNVHLIDWYAISVDHPEYFAPDGIHLEYPGIEAMNKLFGYELNKQK